MTADLGQSKTPVSVDWGLLACLCALCSGQNLSADSFAAGKIEIPVRGGGDDTHFSRKGSRTLKPVSIALRQSLTHPVCCATNRISILSRRIDVPDACCAPSGEHGYRRSAPRPSRSRTTVPIVGAKKPGRRLQGMAYIPGGRFLMGAEDRSGFPADGEGPTREVELSPFFIDETAVTNAEFGRFVRATKIQDRGRAVRVVIRLPPFRIQENRA